MNDPRTRRAAQKSKVETGLFNDNFVVIMSSVAAYGYSSY